MMLWFIMAIISSLFAGLTSVLAKAGIKKTDSDVATAIRTIIVLIFSFIMVLIVGSLDTINTITKKSIIFLILSGLSTGASWLFYFKALSIGDVNKVVPIDKSSTIFTIILAIVFFNERNNIWMKLFGTILLAIGIFLMIEKKSNSQNTSKKFIPYAILSAVFASLMSIFAKIGLSGVESNLGTVIKTFVVLLMSWIIVITGNKYKEVINIDRKELLFIILSGVASGASLLCYYYAIQNGIVSIVVPIDKLSILFSVIFSYFAFGEKLTKRSLIGLIIMIAGIMIIAFSG